METYMVLARIRRSGPDDCWTWSGAHTPSGGKRARQPYLYPVVSYEGKTWRVSRLVLHLAGVRVDGRKVLHICDNPRCVNMRHLRLGSLRDNSTDMVAKGRSLKGEANPGGGKLTEAAVRAIRNDPRSQYVIAEEHGVSQVMVSRIKRRQAWAHI